MSDVPSTGGWRSSPYVRVLIWAAALVLLFCIYVVGIGNSPPGFYVDESGLAYNAYLVSQTGAGEFGGPFPLYFQLYTGGFTQYSNPTQIYLLAAVYSVFGPGILISRLTAAASMFAASLLLGLLAKRISGEKFIGVIVGITALATPWLFQVGRLVLETFLYPLAVVALLWSVYLAYKKDRWSWLNILAIVSSLTFLTYSYTIGRLLAPLFALCLVALVHNRNTIISLAKTWALYAVTMIPLIAFNIQNPEIRTRFSLISYIKPDSTWWEIFTTFVTRYVQDLNPAYLIYYGDTNQRHHLPEALGSIFVATFVVALIGVIVIFVRHRHDRWWWFVLLATTASVVPGALTVDKFHTLRMIAYPVFLLVLTIPAWTYLLDKVRAARPEGDGEIQHAGGGDNGLDLRRTLLWCLLALTAVEAAYFHWQYYQYSPKRGYVFDEAYKPLYDQAVAQPRRPIYLEDGYWGPMYIHSFWYASVDGRDMSEFVHLPYGETPPRGAIVISSDRDCTACQIRRREGVFILYRQTR
ncbi:MAG: glycosyltransferase family 39 protein [Blastocatellia bacterium]|nr:glycosyltransferase family 39 protein [Blastocatellia bacterium]